VSHSSYGRTEQPEVCVRYRRYSRFSFLVISKTSVEFERHLRSGSMIAWFDFNREYFLHKFDFRTKVIEFTCSPSGLELGHQSPEVAGSGTGVDLNKMS
jgi:hypothetical protein